MGLQVANGIITAELVLLCLISILSCRGGWGEVADGTN